jgi:hypothetical protein
VYLDSAKTRRCRDKEESSYVRCAWVLVSMYHNEFSHVGFLLQVTWANQLGSTRLGSTRLRPAARS